MNVFVICNTVLTMGLLLALPLAFLLCCFFSLLGRFLLFFERLSMWMVSRNVNVLRFSSSFEAFNSFKEAFNVRHSSGFKSFNSSWRRVPIRPGAMSKQKKGVR